MGTFRRANGNIAAAVINITIIAAAVKSNILTEHCAAAEAVEIGKRRAAVE